MNQVIQVEKNMYSIHLEFFNIFFNIFFNYLIQICKYANMQIHKYNKYNKYAKI